MKLEDIPQSNKKIPTFNLQSKQIYDYQVANSVTAVINNN